MRDSGELCKDEIHLVGFMSTAEFYVHDGNYTHEAQQHEKKVKQIFRPAGLRKGERSKTALYFFRQ